ncbi:MAG: DNA alkylation repair protein [Clostridiales bacterium]|nr:DNA alkylation repair protein [Clostridiales bacterium]
MLEKIREELKEAAEEQYRIFSAGLLPGTEGILGVRLPKVRKIAKSYVRQCNGEKNLFDQWEEAYHNGQKFFFEELMIWGMQIGYAPLDREERKQRLLFFVERIDNWSVCDSCCITYKFMKEDPEFWWEFLRPLFGNQKEFTVRFAVVCGLDFFIMEDYMEEFLRILESLSCDAYYAQMAQAWALSMCYVAFPKQTEKILAAGKLADMVQNKTIQKIRESRQIGKEEKDKLLKYRRR